jgi:hypothetical protein
MCVVCEKERYRGEGVYAQEVSRRIEGNCRYLSPLRVKWESTAREREKDRTVGGEYAAR